VTQTSRGATAIPKRPAGDPAARPEGHGPLARLGRFYREVVAELRKVIWPTRRELVTYTSVVVVFVSIVVAIVAGLDIVFAKLVLFVFS